MKNIIITLFLIFAFVISAQVNDERVYNTFSEEELVSISRDTNLAAALRALEVLSLQFENKKIISTSVSNEIVGFPINKVYWKDALELIIRLHNLDLEERPGSFMVTDPVVEEQIAATGAAGEVAETITPYHQQVRISSIFFKADKTLSRDIGIDWSTLFGGTVNAYVDFSGASKVSEDIFKAGTNQNFQTGDVTISLDVLLRILEQYQRGSIIAKPSVTVLSGQNGKIQVGQDFSVRSLDDAGNVQETFFSTGIILNVTPLIVEKDGEKAIYMEASVEKSSAVPGDISTIIDKSSSSTKVLLFDGEETVIAGLFDTDKQTSRAGVPFLKDLPWWVFGLRYIFGYNSYAETTNEMIIILKAEIIESLPDRKQHTKPVAEQLKEDKENFEKDKQIFDY